MISGPLVRYVLTAAARDRLMLTLGLMILCGAGLSVFMGSASVTEASSFALVLGAGGLRFLGVIGIVLFCCFYIRRAFENKEVEYLLAKPVSRVTFLFSHALAFCAIAVLVAAAVTAAAALLGRPDRAGLLVWGGSLIMEFSIMAVASLFFSMVLSSAAGSALAALGLYALARMIGTMLGLLAQAPGNWFFAIIGNVMELISIVTPRLDMMGQTSWLVYGTADIGRSLRFLDGAGAYAHWMAGHIGLAGFIVLQGLLAAALLLAAAAHDFRHRQF